MQLGRVTRASQHAIPGARCGSPSTNGVVSKGYLNLFFFHFIICKNHKKNLKHSPPFSIMFFRHSNRPPSQTRFRPTTTTLPSQPTLLVRSPQWPTTTQSLVQTPYFIRVLYPVSGPGSQSFSLCPYNPMFESRVNNNISL